MVNNYYGFYEVKGVEFNQEDLDIRWYGDSVASEVKIHSQSTEDKIIDICDEIKELLLEKNRKYGDSALNPVRVFSHADNLEQLRVRIDDKISRVKSAQLDEDEEVLNDLIGYLILYRVALINE
jgi:hypothetical protein